MDGKINKREIIRIELGCDENNELMFVMEINDSFVDNFNIDVKRVEKQLNKVNEDIVNQLKEGGHIGWRGQE